MALSANSLIHYTSKIDNVLSIIRSRGFRFSYCSEKINTRGSKNFSGAIAMVSFCDIPLSDYKKHFYNKKNTDDLGYYGDYGIGLSKKWANRKGLNSVFYIEYNSYVSTSIRKQFEVFMLGDKRVSHIDTQQVFLYTKNYEGELYRDSKLKRRDYRFYDEREWRLVPDSTTLGGNPTVLDDRVYNADKVMYNTLISHNLLKFEISDISYIIVKNEAEVRLVYQTLHDVFDKDLIDLTTIRVLTSDQITSDF
ncbi:abortive infection system antitoxin AbiGi family protein [Pedobacter ghigonis]|uniref:abortive infection system antitoxin AbiGi family protein n=1 Tax=Pedobacter ghigonis TaxID=2730403 RepID=UPI00158DD63A|nr:abortive infection system antitoxin AbiGi family protein [Pedobacter ghigonis]